MSDKNKFKDLVGQIKKMAEPAPAGDGLGDVWNTPPAPKHQWTGPVGNAAVKAMQQAMIGLADAVMRDAESGAMFKRPGDEQFQQADPATVAYKKSFNDFIAEQYAGNLPEEYKGTEWSQDASVQSRQDKQVGQTDLYELNAVLNTMKRIGSPGANGQEFKADGFWQFRTNNALMNMMGFAYSLLSMEGDFGLNTGVFTPQDLDAMKQLLSGYEVQGDTVKLSEAEKTERATKLTVILKKITKLYTDFRQKITARPLFRTLIEGKRGFDKYTAKGNDPTFLTPQDQQVVTSNPTIGGVQLTGYKDGQQYPVNQISLSALSSPDAFKAFLKQIGYNDQQITQYATQLAQTIADQLAKYTEKQENERRALESRI